MKKPVINTIVGILALNLLSFWTSSAYALSTGAEEYCREIQDARNQIHKVSRGSLIRDLLRLTFAPGKLVQLNKIVVTVPEALKVHFDPATQEGPFAKNIIFSIDPPEEISNSTEFQTMQIRYEELTQLLKKQNKQLMKIATATSVEECVARSEQFDFNFDAYMSLAKEKTSLQVIAQLHEGEIADRMIGRTLSHLKLNWEVVHSTDLTLVHEMLRSPQLQNVVIISHGLADGKLVDSRMSEYPLGFFTDLSPNLHSIAIFACHGEAIAEAYKIKATLMSSPSVSSNRTLFISDGTTLAGMEELVPVKAFRSFMRKVDSALEEEMALMPDETPHGAIYQQPTLCKIEFDGFHVKNGTFGYILNGLFIGSSNADRTDVTVTFPCAFANRTRNILVVRSLSLLGGAGIQSSDFHVLWSSPNQRIHDSKLTHYWRADKSYQSSKFEFSLGQKSN